MVFLTIIFQKGFPCVVLLTLDLGDFGILLNTRVYGMRVETPRDFLLRQGIG